MRKFVKNSIAFTVVTILVLAIIEISLLFVPNTYSYKRDYIETHIKDIKILLMGSSYIEEGICPELIGDSCFNLAISGRNIIYDAEIARKYFSRMDNLKIVVLPLDYSKFEFGRGENNTLDKRIDLERFTDTYRCMHYKYMNLHVDGFWLWSEILNSRLNFLARFWKPSHENVECDSLGFVALSLDNRQSDWRYRSLPPLVDLSKKIDRTAFELYWPYIEAIADCTYKNGIKLMLVEIPKYKTFQSFINNDVIHEKNELISKLRERFKNVDYYDYTYCKDFVEDDFYDACHLSDVGAKKFSNILRDKIVN